MFDDKRADIVIADGLKYLAETDERFDAIIVDSSEPIGPSAVLHTREFFTDCKRSLKDGGILVTQMACRSCSPSTCRHHGGVRLPVQAGGALHVHASLLFRRSVRAQPGDRRQASAQARRRRPRQAQRKRGIDGSALLDPAGHVGAFALPAYAQQVVEAAIQEAEDKGKKAKAYAQMPKKAKAKAKKKAS